tara:strand:+ start:229 stop:1284 length:1056 start_codon:yes stop_codon:yes gene_type:complete
MASTSLRIANRKSAALFIRSFLSEMAPHTVEAGCDVSATLEADTESVVDEWRAVMHTPLPDSVKYAKAIARLQNGTAACCYNACDFNDAEAVAVAVPGLVKFMGAYSRASDAEKRTLWNYVKQINRLVHDAGDEDVAPTPSREAIRKNIAEFKATRAHAGAGAGTASGATAEPLKTGGAFRMTVSKQFPGELPNSLAARSDDDWSDLSRQYAQFLGVQFVGGLTPTQLCDAKDPRLFEEAWPVIDEVRLALASQTMVGDRWSELQQINSMTVVENRVPKNMMRNIEAYAQDIAGQLMNGSMTFEDMSIEKIGQDVLTQCSPEDMQQLASNADALMPTLSALQSTMMKNMSK